MELAVCVFDHVSVRYKKGFRLLTLGGLMVIPSFDHQTLSHKRQEMTKEKDYGHDPPAEGSAW